MLRVLADDPALALKEAIDGLERALHEREAAFGEGARHLIRIDEVLCRTGEAAIELDCGTRLAGFGEHELIDAFGAGELAQERPPARDGRGVGALRQWISEAELARVCLELTLRDLRPLGVERPSTDPLLHQYRRQELNRALFGMRRRDQVRFEQTVTIVVIVARALRIRQRSQRFEQCRARIREHQSVEAGEIHPAHLGIDGRSAIEAPPQRERRAIVLICAQRIDLGAQRIQAAQRVGRRQVDIVRCDGSDPAGRVSDLLLEPPIALVRDCERHREDEGHGGGGGQGRPPKKSDALAALREAHRRLVGEDHFAEQSRQEVPSWHLARAWRARHRRNRHARDLLQRKNPRRRSGTGNGVRLLHRGHVLRRRVRHVDRLHAGKIETSQDRTTLQRARPPDLPQKLDDERRQLADLARELVRGRLPLGRMLSRQQR